MRIYIFTMAILPVMSATHVDMVVMLHACDTATDYAMAKAVRWGADVILVRRACGRHELNSQISNGRSSRFW